MKNLRSTFYPLLQGKSRKVVLAAMPSVVLICSLLFMAASCEQEYPVEPNTPDPPCNCIMDTLKGDWIWIKMVEHGIPSDNEFKSVIRILGQNEDESINYEVFVEDILFYKGSFQIQYDQWTGAIGYSGEATMVLPHFGWQSGEIVRQPFPWFIYFGNPRTGITSRHILCFDNCPINCFVEGDKYYYHKIGTEE